MCAHQVLAAEQGTALRVAEARSNLGCYCSHQTLYTDYNVSRGARPVAHACSAGHVWKPQGMWRASLLAGQSLRTAVMLRSRPRSRRPPTTWERA